MTFSPLIIWAKATFFFEQLFLVVAVTWFPLRSERFFWAQNLGFWSKIPIFAIRPQFWSMTQFIRFGNGILPSLLHKETARKVAMSQKLSLPFKAHPREASKYN